MFIKDARYDEGGIWVCETDELGFDRLVDWETHLDMCGDRE